MAKLDAACRFVGELADHDVGVGRVDIAELAFERALAHDRGCRQRMVDEVRRLQARARGVARGEA